METAGAEISTRYQVSVTVIYYIAHAAHAGVTGVDSRCPPQMETLDWEGLRTDWEKYVETPGSCIYRPLYLG